MVNVLELINLPNLPGHLERVETCLERSVAAEDPFLTEVAGHLVRAGGKRLRPSLTLAASGMDGSASEEAVQGGVAVELVHLGSLYHDDVMDDAATRRGVETVNHRWGNLVAILAGDFLLARASELAAQLGTEVAGLLAHTISRLCEGQLAELKMVFNVERSEPAYFASITAKTAALMAASCRIGALVAGRPRAEIDSLTSFGEQFGIVFQIVDDVLDVVSTEEELGKPAGHDMVEGVYTLPVIRTLRGAGGDELRPLLGRRLSPAERDKARDIVRVDGGVPAAIVAGRDYADRADRALAGIGPTPLLGLGHRLLDTVA